MALNPCKTHKTGETCCHDLQTECLKELGNQLARQLLAQAATQSLGGLTAQGAKHMSSILRRERCVLETRTGPSGMHLLLGKEQASPWGPWHLQVGAALFPLPAVPPGSSVHVKGLYPSRPRLPWLSLLKCRCRDTVIVGVWRDDSTGHVPPLVIVGLEASFSLCRWVVFLTRLSSPLVLCSACPVSTSCLGAGLDSWPSGTIQQRPGALGKAATLGSPCWSLVSGFHSQKKGWKRTVAALHLLPSLCEELVTELATLHEDGGVSPPWEDRAGRVVLLFSTGQPVLRAKPCKSRV